MSRQDYHEKKINKNFLIDNIKHIFSISLFWVISLKKKKIQKIIDFFVGEL